MSCPGDRFSSNQYISSPGFRVEGCAQNAKAADGAASIDLTGYPACTWSVAEVFRWKRPPCGGRYTRQQSQAKFDGLAHWILPHAVAFGIGTLPKDATPRVEPR
jgi:hypothetical protein